MSGCLQYFSSATIQTTLKGCNLLGDIGFLIVVVLIIGAMLGAYFCLGFALMRIAERQEVPNGWAAFVPFAQFYLMGELLTHKLGNKGGLKILVIFTLIFLTRFIPFVGDNADIPLMIFNIILMHLFFSRYSKESTAMTVVNTLTLGLFGNFGLFAIRNNPDRLAVKEEV